MKQKKKNDIAAPAGHPPSYPSCIQGQTTQQIADTFQAFSRAPGIHCHQDARKRGIDSGAGQAGEVCEEQHLTGA